MFRIVIFILGTVVGSFVNVVVGRFGQEKKWWQGRSFCDECRHVLKWWENIPIVSYLILKGRCLTCHSPIPLEYTLVELTTGLVFVLTFLHSSTALATLLNCSVATLLILIFLFDLHYQIIPDWCILGLIGLAVLINLGGSRFSSGTIRGFLSLVLTGLGASLFFLLLHLITRGRGMGLGDVKYTFFMGLFLGWPKIIIGLYTAFLTGAIIGVILILMNKKKFGQQISFGPFLVFGTFVSWFWGEELISNIYYLLSNI